MLGSDLSSVVLAYQTQPLASFLPPPPFQMTPWVLFAGKNLKANQASMAVENRAFFLLATKPVAFLKSPFSAQLRARTISLKSSTDKIAQEHERPACFGTDFSAACGASALIKLKLPTK